MGDKNAATHRLTDIRTKEVSFVDEAANERRFLVVKSAGEDNAMADKPGAEVKPNGQGGHTAVNKDAAGGGTPAAQPAAQAAPVMKMAATVKADVLKRLDEVLKGAGELKAQVEKATEDATVTAVPEELAKSLGTVLVDPLVDVAKGYKQATPARLQEFKGAVGKLNALLQELDLAATSTEQTPTNAAALGVTPAAQAAAPAAPAVDVASEVSKGVGKAMAPVTQTFEAVTTSLTTIEKSIGKLAERVNTMERGGRVSSNATPSETPARTTTRKAKKNAWPTDLAARPRGETKKKRPDARG